MSTAELGTPPEPGVTEESVVWSSLIGYAQRHHLAVGTTLMLGSIGGLIATGLELGVDNPDTAPAVLGGFVFFVLGVLCIAYRQPKPEYKAELPAIPTAIIIEPYVSQASTIGYIMLFDESATTKLSKLLPAPVASLTPLEQQSEEQEAV